MKIEHQAMINKWGDGGPIRVAIKVGAVAVVSCGAGEVSA